MKGDKGDTEAIKVARVFDVGGQIAILLTVVVLLMTSQHVSCKSLSSVLLSPFSVTCALSA